MATIEFETGMSFDSETLMGQKGYIPVGVQVAMSRVLPDKFVSRWKGIRGNGMRTFVDQRFAIVHGVKFPIWIGIVFKKVPEADFSLYGATVSESEEEPLS